jgi:hypothetical protein
MNPAIIRPNPDMRARATLRTGEFTKLSIFLGYFKCGHDPAKSGHSLTRLKLEEGLTALWLFMFAMTQ